MSLTVFPPLPELALHMRTCSFRFFSLSYSYCSSLPFKFTPWWEGAKILKNDRVCKIYNGNEHKSDFFESLCRNGVETGQDNAQATPGSWKTTPGPGTYRHMSPDRTGKWEAPIERVTSGPLQSKACQGISLPHSLPPLPLCLPLASLSLLSLTIHPSLSIYFNSIYTCIPTSWERARKKKREKRKTERWYMYIYVISMYVYVHIYTHLHTHVQVHLSPCFNIYKNEWLASSIDKNHY